MITPHTKYEENLFSCGYKNIAGLDEAGRGAWAGPIVAAAVIMPRGSFLEGVNDSKLLNPKQREFLALKIKKMAISWAVGIVDIDFINYYNIGRANIKAFEEAVLSLNVKPDYLLIDGILKFKSKIPYQAIKDGDAQVYSISAASIIAKVTRDNILKEAHLKFPEYGFEKHKGYGTKFHQEALEKYGVSIIHRILYKPIRKYLDYEKEVKS